MRTSWTWSTHPLGKRQRLQTQRKPTACWCRWDLPLDVPVQRHGGWGLYVPSSICSNGIWLKSTLIRAFDQHYPRWRLLCPAVYPGTKKTQIIIHIIYRIKLFSLFLRSIIGPSTLKALGIYHFITADNKPHWCWDNIYHITPNISLLWCLHSLSIESGSQMLSLMNIFKWVRCQSPYS